MKLFYGIVLVLMIFISACAQQAAQPEAQPSEPESAVVEPEPEAEGTGSAVAVPEEVKETTSEEIRVLGKGGVEPLELTITAGSSVTWIYDADIVSVITISKDGVSYLNTPLLKTGDKFEHEFAEAGEYTYFAVAYGPQGAKITVE